MFQKKKLEFYYWIIFQWPFFGEKKSNTWIVGSTRINKIYLSYVKPSFALWIYIILEHDQWFHENMKDSKRGHTKVDHLFA
jgi:hypothetical protein